ncbi:MAG: adenosylcobinamide-GDP ribazoletransferase [Acidimicrobiaceae bacterium]|nr:adenosylcobinamide-GDP ribazoletransferase [Acidimicrobiaceae bacterium]
MAEQIDALLSSVAFLSSFRTKARPSRLTPRYFGVVGMLLGLLLGLIWRIASSVFTPAIAAIVVVGADIFLTYGLHYDAIADCGDGLFAHMKTERRLEVMRQPAIGSFGATAVLLVILLRVTSLATISVSPALLVGLLGMSRSMMALAVGRGNYARPNGGMASIFLGAMSGGADFAVVLPVMALSIVLVLIGAGVFAGLVALLVALGSTAYFYRRGVSLLGGFTGDLVGGSGILFETVALLVLTAKGLR